MADQFTTFGYAKLMISSVTYDRAAEIADEIRSMDGVQSVTFDDSSDHYNNVSALYDITFDYPEADSACVEALNAVLERYSTYDTYLDTTLGNQLAEIIQSEVNVIMVIVAAIVAPVVNTGIFLLGCLVFFLPTVTEWGQAMGFESVGKYMILGLVGGNFLFELLFNVILSPVIVRLIRLGKKDNK